MTRFWVVRGGREGEFEALALERNEMFVGWETMGDLRDFKDRDAILEGLRKMYPDSPKGRLSKWATQLYRFVNDIRAGDLVAMPGKRKKDVFIGEVDGEYRFDPGSKLRHSRRVRWNEEPVPRNVFKEDLLGSFNSSGTLFEVIRNDAVKRVRAVLGNGSDPGAVEPVEPAGDGGRFEWIPFYEALADRLLDFADRRKELLARISAVKSRMDKDNVPFTNLEDIRADGSKGPLKDICPFTSMGTFSRSIKPANRKIIARAFAESFGVPEPWPDFPAPDETGIPLLYAAKSWFFGFENQRRPDDIDRLWEIFRRAIGFARSGDEESRAAFAKAYDEALEVSNTAWNLTMGLYWIRPWNFPTLDDKSRKYITETLGMPLPRKVLAAAGYLKIMDDLKDRFEEKDCPVHSFPELSLAAWKKRPLPGPEHPVEPGPPAVPYTVADIMEEGYFLEPSSIEEMLERLRSKKNIVLQGPPGTGKTWLAKKLAFVLVGRRDEANIRAVQFHPSLSYEDFVRGWRPSGDGKLELVDGPFLEIAETAKRSPRETYVIVIEEINRGNPAQILGELLTLLEADKRTRESALALSYPRDGGERVFLPENLYVIGTMNIADRSLALVDFALRRRFAFIDLEPALNDRWKKWCHQKCGISYGVLDRIRSRIEALNERISSDPNLGPQFRIGHSYVTPNSTVKDPDAWFRQMASTEIGPLLEEYWFDSPETAREARRNLLEGE